MPHVFGNDAFVDCAWIGLLTQTDVNPTARRQLIRAGWHPGMDLDPNKWDPSLIAWVRRVESGLPGIQWQPPNWCDSQVTLLTLADTEYPPQLAVCNDAPPALFVMGSTAVLSMPAVAVVGTRAPSAAGLQQAGLLAADLAATGLVVVSGLARGIDAEAHREALITGASIAVMATGIDQIYPKGHRALAQRLVQGGAVISEFPPGFEASRWHFPRRNRTISGLALATVVVEAGRPSGSLLTATAAAEQGRDVYAFPWSVTHRGGEGCLYLLADGALLARSAQDVIAGLSCSVAGQLSLLSRQLPSGDASSELGTLGTLKAEPLPSDAQALATWLGDSELTFDELLALTGNSVTELRRLLAREEIAGRLTVTANGYRCRS